MRQTELRKLTSALNLTPYPMDHEITEAVIKVAKEKLGIWTLAQLVSEQVQNARKGEGKE